jgi:exodeoxyribonuclease V alpha subunit
MQEIENKKFKVEKIVYYDKKSNWGVLATKPIDNLGSVQSKLTNKYGNISVTGNFEGVFEGADVVLSAVTVDGKYGLALQVKSLQVIHDTKTREGIVNFLARSLIKGISVQNALKIYDNFKYKSIDVVFNEPHRLEQIKGIGEKTVNKVKESIKDYRRMKPLIDYCTKLGLPYILIKKLDEELGSKALEVIETEPYKVLDLTGNITFRQIDEIYIKSGGKPTATVRLEAGLLYALKNEATLEGSTGLKSSILKNRFYSLLGLSGENSEYESIVHKLSSEEKIYITEGAITGYETGYVYYKPYVDIERNIAEKIQALNTYGVLGDDIKESVVDEEVHDFPFKLNEKQVEAVHDCLNHNVSVLTGPAGCGKSSIIKALSNIYARCGFNVQLLSPTAKACRRLEECVGGFQAQTIHKFLGMKKDNEYKAKSSYPPKTVLVIDEASMMDIMLFNNLLLSADLSTRVLIIGDNNQLPSVQAGNVLGDLIDSKKVHVSLLTDVMRQQEDSNIIKFCNKTNNGVVFDPIESKDFHYEEFGEGTELRDFFYQEYIKAIEAVGLNEVQVITPYKKGELGMDNLNTFIQGKYNKDGALTLEPFRIGDKVRHTQNDYKREVFNGETGTIISFDEEDETLRVDFGNKIITYEKQDLADLVLAYCSTVHASQGSEYKIVFVILDDTSVNDFLHIRRLLYTAISRGKQKVYLLSKPYLVDKCIENNVYRPRITKLKEFLNEK